MRCACAVRFWRNAVAFGAVEYALLYTFSTIAPTLTAALGRHCESSSIDSAGLPSWLTTALAAVGWAGSLGWLAILAICVAIAVPSVRTFVGAYLKTRGETYATKQDFEELLRQLRIQTEATEDIKQRLSFAGWRGQRGWELKREFYWNLIRKLTERQQIQMQAWSKFNGGDMTGGLAAHRRILEHWPEIAAELNIARAVLAPAAIERYAAEAAAYFAAGHMEGLTTTEQWTNQMQREIDASRNLIAAVSAAAHVDLFDRLEA
jgi:hypothetical protein